MKYIMILSLLTSCSTYTAPVTESESPAVVHLSEMNSLIAVIKPLCNEPNAWNPSHDQERAMERLNEVSECEIDISEICEL